jgi:toxin
VNPKNLLDLDKAEILNLGLSVNNARYLIQVKELIANIRLPKFIENLRLKHILQGDKGGGGHHLPSLAAGDHTLVNIPTSPNNKGVYRATIKYENYNGKIVTTTKTMFPDHWTPQEVIDRISEAYKDTNKINIEGNKYIGKDRTGMEIMMYINENGNIISAHPKL